MNTNAILYSTDTLETKTETSNHSVPSELNINIKNGVATLSGNANSTDGLTRVERLVSRISEVNLVINLVTSKTQHNI